MGFPRNRLLAATACVALSSCATLPEGITVWVESPSSVELGERFTVSAHVDNASRSVVTLRTLDIGDSYLEGIAIVGSARSADPAAICARRPRAPDLARATAPTIIAATPARVTVRARAG